VILGWAHDYLLSERLGGAQLTNAEMLRHVPDGIEIVHCLPGKVLGADAYVLNNVKRFSFDELYRMTRRPYVKFEHDYWDTPQRWQRQSVRDVMRNARAVVFLSPLHRQTFQRHWGITLDNAHLVPSAIDATPFYSAPERWGTCWLGVYRDHKGVREACAWAEEHGEVDFYGFGPETPSGPNVCDRGSLEYARVPDVLARYERFLFLPRWHEPFGRTVAEALLSGCQVVGNDRIGCLSWDWQGVEHLRAAVTTAPVTFWEIIQRAL